MATTETELVNLSIDLLGGNEITSLDDGSSNARIAKRALPVSRKAVIRDIAPNFARRYDLLTTPTTDLRIPDFVYVYALPPASLRVLYVKDEGDPDVDFLDRPGLVPVKRFRVVGRFLGADISPAELIYLEDIDSYLEWDANTFDALVAYIAWKLAIPVTESIKVRKDMWDQYLQMKDVAQMVDGLEGTRDSWFTDNSLSTVRRQRSSSTGWQG